MVGMEASPDNNQHWPFLIAQIHWCLLFGLLILILPLEHWGSFYNFPFLFEGLLFSEVDLSYFVGQSLLLILLESQVQPYYLLCLRLTVDLIIRAQGKRFRDQMCCVLPNTLIITFEVERLESPGRTIQVQVIQPQWDLLTLVHPSEQYQLFPYTVIPQSHRVHWRRPFPTSLHLAQRVLLRIILQQLPNRLPCINPISPKYVYIHPILSHSKGMPQRKQLYILHILFPPFYHIGLFAHDDKRVNRCFRTLL